MYLLVYTKCTFSIQILNVFVRKGILTPSAKAQQACVLAFCSLCYSMWLGCLWHTSLQCISCSIRMGYWCHFLNAFCDDNHVLCAVQDFLLPIQKKLEFKKPRFVFAHLLGWLLDHWQVAYNPAGIEFRDTVMCDGGGWRESTGAIVSMHKILSCFFSPLEPLIVQFR